jgi:allantoinase
VLTEAEGVAPQGLALALDRGSRDTPDLLAEAGYGYTLNWCMDDQPVWMRTSRGRCCRSPTRRRSTTFPSIVARKDGARAFADMIVDNFDEMLEQSRQQPLVMGVALHPYLVGQPYRLRHLRRALSHIVKRRGDIWLCRAGDIHDFCRAEIPDLVP